VSPRKNIVEIFLSRLDIDSLKIQEEEVLINQIPNAYCLDLQRTSKSQDQMIKRKGLNPNTILNTTY
jgi:hypothetical protein